MCISRHLRLTRNVISRILRNCGRSCLRLCHTERRKYFSTHVQDGGTRLYCVKSRDLVKTNERRATDSVELVRVAVGRARLVVLIR